MNPFLADLYNTAENVGLSKTASDSTESLAQAAILDQMFSNEGLDINQISASELVKVAAEIFGANSPLVKAAECEGVMPSSEAPPEEKKEEPKKEEGKKEEEVEAEKMASEMAKADLLGRQMAHAYVDELSRLEKQASAQPQQPAQPTAGPIAAILGRIKTASQQPQASALDILAKQRAEEMLKQAQAASPEAQLEAAVQKRAVEMLKAAGYQVG